MKFFISTLILFSINAWAKPLADFNSVLMEKVQEDIQKDEDKFKTRSPVSRGPASVGASEDADDVRVQETPKMDKNIRQIGPNKW